MPAHPTTVPALGIPARLDMGGGEGIAGLLRVVTAEGRLELHLDLRRHVVASFDVPGCGDDEVEVDPVVPPDVPVAELVE